MLDKKNLREEYIQNLEQSIVEQFAIQQKIDLRQAMDIYYKSKLATQIEAGLYGIENLDYRYLVQDLIENELETT